MIQCEVSNDRTTAQGAYPLRLSAPSCTTYQMIPRPQVRWLLPETAEELRPAGWEEQLRSSNPLRPFSLKHARQQASIVGHMQRWGLAPRADRSHLQVRALQTSLSRDTSTRPRNPCWCNPGGSGSRPPQLIDALHTQNHSDADKQSCQQSNGSDARPLHCGAGALPAPDASCPAPRVKLGAEGSVADSTFVDITFVEFGAGKGYLTALLAECTGARKLVIMDQGAFGLKADRHVV